MSEVKMKKAISLSLLLLLTIFQLSALDAVALRGNTVCLQDDCSNPTFNFASIRLFKKKDHFKAGGIVFTRIPLLDQIVVHTGGNVDFINDNGSIHVGTPGNFHISYGISASKDQRVRILVDGAPIDGSTLSCARNKQMTSQSIIANVNETIALQAVDDLLLLRKSKEDVIAFIEIIQLDCGPIANHR